MLQLRDVVDCGADAGGRVAVVHVFDDDRVAIMALDDDLAWPRIVSGVDLEASIDAGMARLLDPVLPPSALRLELSKAEQAARDRRWAAIAPIVAAVPEVFDPKQRADMIGRVPATAGTAPTIRKSLRWYWQRGMTPAALVGDWTNCGAKGVERDEGGRKRGRPVKHGTFTGVNIDRPLRLLIRKVIWSRWRKHRKLNLMQALTEVRSRYFYEGEHVEGVVRTKPKLKPEFEKTGSLKEDAFYKFFYKYVDGLGLRRERRGARIWDTTGRGLPGTVTAETRGPGSRYAIDATILDVYVRSRINPEQIVGRAVLYVVIDVWSRLIVGIYIGIENASWACAMMALANVIENKVDYCRIHGIEIEPHEWPDAGIGERLLSDGGEMTAKVADQLALHFNMKVETASAYRGDLKGIVENVFNVVPTSIAAYVPGWIEPDFRKRGAKDYRVESALDIEDVTRMVILAVIHRNNNVAVKRYDRDVGMPAAEVASFPVDLWSYGVAYRTGRFVRWPSEFVRFRLMPEETATVDAHGLRFRGAWYLSDGLLARGWLEEGRKKPFDVRVSFDPRYGGSVYLHLAETEFGFEVCTLNQSRSRAFGDPEAEPSFWDIDLEEHDRKDMLADAAEREAGSRVGLAEDAKRIAAEALERQAGVRPMTDAEQTKGIGENRKLERAMNQAIDAAVFALDPEPKADGVPVTGQQADEDENYDYDISDIVGEGR